MRYQRRLVAAVMVAFLAAVGIAAPSSPATAAVPTQVDVGVTINDRGVWKGSGSYSNGSGLYVRFCVELRVDRPGDDYNLSVRCEATPPGGQGQFSAPDVACWTRLGWAVYTRAIAYDAYGNWQGRRTSNRIPMGC